MVVRHGQRRAKRKEDEQWKITDDRRAPAQALVVYTHHLHSSSPRLHLNHPPFHPSPHPSAVPSISTTPIVTSTSSISTFST